MLLILPDLPLEGNKARRLFWEMCASRAPLEVQRGVEGCHRSLESCAEIALWADWMLEEWDKRWIAEPDDDKDITQTNEVLP